MTNMIKLLNFIFALAISAVLVVPSVQAQSPTTVASPSSACSTTVWMCPATTDLDAGHIGPHRLRLEASNLPTKNPVNGLPVDVHVVCGISTPDGDLFTSGDSQTDQRLCIGEGTLAKLKNRPYEYKLSYLSGTNPFRSPYLVLCF